LEWNHNTDDAHRKRRGRDEEKKGEKKNKRPTEELTREASNENKEGRRKREEDEYRIIGIQKKHGSMMEETGGWKIYTIMEEIV